MRNSACVAAVAALALGSLLSTAVGHADPTDPSPNCAVPDRVAGKFLVLRGTTRSAPAAPSGDSTVVVRFHTADTLRYLVVGTGGWHEGTYRYSVPEPGRAVIDSTQTDTREPVTYSLMLRCHDDVSGDFTYAAGGSTEQAPDNVAVYRFQDEAP
ncbi:hypothetical protein [Nocardia sp. NPDC057668]|uniref:hypothetical protein n=1 Tax=Nocardia sp. NPDC057668 TaxID=3346202 RepID=UPI003670E2C4